MRRPPFSVSRTVTLWTLLALVVAIWSQGAGVPDRSCSSEPRGADLSLNGPDTPGASAFRLKDASPLCLPLADVADLVRPLRAGSSGLAVTGVPPGPLPEMSAPPLAARAPPLV